MLKKLCALLLLACFCSASALPEGIYLTGSEVRAIREELQRMSEATTLLQSELNSQRERSQTLQEMSQRLQGNLESVLSRLEASQELLEISGTELAALSAELAVLRMEYSVLWESWTMQKNEAQRWKRLAAAGWISAAMIFIGGLLWTAVK